MITVYLYNIVEDEWDFIRASGRSRRLTKEIEVMEDTGDCFFLAAAAAYSRFIYICPKPVGSKFRRYTRSLFPHSQGEIIVPRRRQHQLCLDLIGDQGAFRRLISRLAPFGRIKLLAYSSSPQFYRLAAALAGAGLKVFTPESPAPPAAWTVKFFGSKSGIRQLAGPLLPPGLICANPAQASQIAAAKYINNHGVVIKTDRGSGGSGVLLFRENSLPNHYSAGAAQLEKIFGRKPYWKKFPIVVEDLVSVDPRGNNNFPDAEYKIKPGGGFDLLFFGVMKVNKKGEYCGMDVNASLLPRRLKSQLLKQGKFVAEKLSAAGYRGHFDVDMLAAASGRLYLSESNTRNTGWTDVYRIVKKLIGPDFLNRAYVFNRDDLRLPKNRWTDFDQLLAALQPLLFSPKTRSGIIISSEKTLARNYLYYTVIAPDKTAAYAYRKKLINRLHRPLAHRI